MLTTSSAIGAIVEIIKNAVKAGWDTFRDAIIKPVSRPAAFFPIKTDDYTSSRMGLALYSTQCDR